MAEAGSDIVVSGGDEKYVEEEGYVQRRNHYR